jgi:PTS system galactitol-specific IIA component
METPEKKDEANFTIDEKLILVKESAGSSEDIIKKLGKLLFDNGFVKDTYTQAVLDREKVYPTGLQARVTGVAVPHTDTQHVLKPAIAIATLTKPVTFNLMATKDDKVEVEVVIMLAVHDAKLVIPILRKIIFILENDAALTKIKDAENKEEIKNAMVEHIESLKQKGGSPK